MWCGELVLPLNPNGADWLAQPVARAMLSFDHVVKFQVCWWPVRQGYTRSHLEPGR